MLLFIVVILCGLCVFMCVPGFQGAGSPSHCHHISYWFLLLCKLCEGWHAGDASTWLIWLPSRGNAPYLYFHQHHWIIFAEFTQTASFLPHISLFPSMFWGTRIGWKISHVIVCLRNTGAKRRRKYRIHYWNVLKFERIFSLHVQYLGMPKPLHKGNRKLDLNKPIVQKFPLDCKTL